MRVVHRIARSRAPVAHRPRNHSSRKKDHKRQVQLCGVLEQETIHCFRAPLAMYKMVAYPLRRNASHAFVKQHQSPQEREFTEI
jgi:hypothetical protein